MYIILKLNDLNLSSKKSFINCRYVHHSVFHTIPYFPFEFSKIIHVISGRSCINYFSAYKERDLVIFISRIFLLSDYFKKKKKNFFSIF